MNEMVSGNSGGVSNCFLCAPPRDLVFYECAEFFVLAGLGPVVEGYSVIGAKEHVRSMADMPMQQQGKRDEFVRMLRDRLSTRYGRCVVTEHGRMAVCVDESGDHEAHCFHAHFLVFPGARDISDRARSYFLRSVTFGTLRAAMSYAAGCDEYLLVSPTSDSFNIFSGPVHLPRQLARILVAHDAKALHLADWREHPDRERARKFACDLKSLFVS
jgi:diadenosine tetraphosphate (Ap4A) HIT family hydrolase